MLSEMVFKKAPTDEAGRSFDIVQACRTHDAYSIAAWLRRADHDGSLAAFLKPVLTPPERTVAQVEGWILGVPGLNRESVLDHEVPSQTRH